MVPRLRRFFDVRPGEGLRSSSRSSTSRSSSRRSCSRSRSATACSCGKYGPYALVYVYAAVPLALSLFVPVYTRVAARFGARTVTVGDAGVLQPQRRRCSGTRSGLPAAFDGWLARRVLRVGQLLRRDCAGAGVELREFAVRHPAGEAAVRADRGRRVARRDRRRAPGAVPGRAGRRHGQHDARARRPHSARRRDRHRRRTARIPRASASRAADGRPAASVPRNLARDRREPVPAADGRAGVPGRDRDAVDGVPAEPRRRSALRRRRGRADRSSSARSTSPLGVVSFLLQLLVAGRVAARLRAWRSTILVAAAGARARQPADPARSRRSGPCCSPTGSTRGCGSRSTRPPTSCCICRSRRRSARRSRTRSTSSSTASPTPSGRCSSALATQGFFVLPAARTSGCAARRPSTSVTIGIWMRRRVAAARRVRPHDPGQHPPAPDRHRARHRRRALERSAADVARARSSARRDVVRGALRARSDREAAHSRVPACRRCGSC